MAKVTEMKRTLHNTLTNLTKFLKFYWRKNLFLPVKDKTYFANFGFPSSDTWQSSCVMQAEMKLIFHNWELSFWCCSLSGLLCCFVFVFPTAHYSPEVSPRLHVSITYLCSCLILYSPAALTMPDKFWDCDECYQYLFIFTETKARKRNYLFKSFMELEPQPGGQFWPNESLGADLSRAKLSRLQRVQHC